MNKIKVGVCFALASQHHIVYLPEDLSSPCHPPLATYTVPVSYTHLSIISSTYGAVLTVRSSTRVRWPPSSAISLPIRRLIKKRRDTTCLLYTSIDGCKYPSAEVC